MRNRVVLILAGVIAIGFVVSLGVQKAWTGRTQVHVEFEVFDRITGAPISGATIRVRPTDGPPPPDSPDLFELVTDERGLAFRIRENRIAGRDKIGHLHTPDWEITAGAPGYQESEPVYAFEQATWRKPVIASDQPHRVKLSFALRPE